MTIEGKINWCIGTNIFQEYDIVVAKTKIKDVPKGTSGSVVHIYDNGNAFEVEFVLKDSSIVATVLNNQIESKK